MNSSVIKRSLPHYISYHHVISTVCRSLAACNSLVFIGPEPQPCDFLPFLLSMRFFLLFQFPLFGPKTRLSYFIPFLWSFWIFNILLFCVFLIPKVFEAFLLFFENCEQWKWAAANPNLILTLNQWLQVKTVRQCLRAFEFPVDSQKCQENRLEKYFFFENFQRANLPKCIPSGQGLSLIAKASSEVCLKYLLKTETYMRDLLAPKFFVEIIIRRKTKTERRLGRRTFSSKI